MIVGADRSLLLTDAAAERFVASLGMTALLLAAASITIVEFVRVDEVRIGPHGLPSWGEVCCAPTRAIHGWECWR